MSAGMPELGSKISLISKADIRYEGHLFTVDPQKCTIALAAVRSFGTEERETSYPVPPQNQVYDYILFRGSDIKDIRVLNNVTSLPNDPAIMQLSVPTTLSNQPFQPQGFSHPVIGQMGQFGGAAAAAAAAAAAGYGPMDALAPGMRGPSLIGGNPSELNMPGPPVPPPDHHLSPGVLDAHHPARSSENDLIGGGSRSTTPASLGSRKSPTAEQGTQAGGKKDDKKIVRPIQPPRSKDRRDSRGEPQEHRNQNNRPPNQQQQQRNLQQQPQMHQQFNNQQQGQRQGQGQGNWVRGSAVRQQRARGRPRGGGGFGGPPSASANNAFNKQHNKQSQQQGQVGKPKIKFDSEYDFELANSEFEELCAKLGKTKLEDVKQEVNGGVGVGGATAVESDKKDDSGNETGAGEPELEEECDVYYDKAKSFFDNISCEAVERSKGRSQRTDWRTERKLNSETFGVAASRRGGFLYFRYRGRGGYRGNFRGGYRGNNFRNQQNQQPRVQGNEGARGTNQPPGGGAAAPVGGNQINSAPAPVPAAAGK